MFKKSHSKPPNLFNGIMNVAGEKKYKKLYGQNQVHNIFYREVTSRIDESVFSVLYCLDNGRPNASIRQLVAMMVLKEGEGWTDEQLFSACNFDLRVMLSLGMVNVSDEAPCSSTFYQFKASLEQHKVQTGEDMLERCFEQITLDQMDYHGVSGQRIRLDSKLVQSNISKSSRLGLLLEGLRKHVSSKLDFWQHKVSFSVQEIELLQQLQEEKPHRILYYLTGDEQKDLLKKTGYLYRKLAEVSHTESIITQLYEQHFQVKKTVIEEQKDQGIGSGKDSEQGDERSDELPEVEPIENKELKATNIQSIHDTQAAYRQKNGQKIHGYHVEVTETCSKDNDINLITEVSTQKANESECDFLRRSIEKTNRLLAKKNNPEQVKEAIMDGGYDSIENRDWVLSLSETIELIMTKFKGKPQKYEMSWQGENKDELSVKIKATGQECKVCKEKKNTKVVVIEPDGKRRYFSEEQIRNYINRQRAFKTDNKLHQGLRANVESTIHQMFCKLERRYKTRYRGQTRSHYYVLSRAIWVNFTRISGKIAEKSGFFTNLATTIIITLRTKIIFARLCQEPVIIQKQKEIYSL